MKLQLLKEQLSVANLDTIAFLESRGYAVCLEYARGYYSAEIKDKDNVTQAVASSQSAKKAVSAVYGAWVKSADYQKNFGLSRKKVIG